MREDSFLNGFAPPGLILFLSIYAVCIYTGYYHTKNDNYEEVCIEGIRYIKSHSSKSSFTPVIDKDGKPLECKHEG